MSQLRDVAVKVNNGSGVLVQLQDKSYVITAIHCIDENGENTILSADEKIKYNVENMFFHPRREQDKEKKNEGDIVLFEVKGMGTFSPYKMTNNVYTSDEVQAYGFPTKNRLGERLDAKVSQWNKDIKTIKTDSNYTGSNVDDEKAKNNIEGWSGSGVFKKIIDEYVLIGILKSLTHTEHIFQTVNCIPVETIMELIEYNGLSNKEPTLLTDIPEKNEEFRGRKSDLKRIQESLQKDNLSCVVNGIGGIGKSELSYEYLHQYKNVYDRVAVVKMLEEQKSLEETFFFSFPKLSEVNGEKNFKTLMKQLQRYGGKNLLVVDNLQHSDDFKKIKPLSLNFDVIITTRIKLDSNNILNLETLNNDDAKELFLSIYSTDEKIDDILKYLDNHPLFIKLIAYSLKERYMKLDEVMSSELPEIDSTDDKTFKEHLQRTFDRQFKSQSRDELKELLQKLALFPAIEIDLEILEKILGGKRLEAKLQKLVNQGWLINKDNSYKLHQIIKIFMKGEYPIAYENIIYILDNIGNYIDPDDSTLVANRLSDYIPVIDSLLAFFEDKRDEHIAKILDSNTYLYYSLGEYDNSFEMQIKSLDIRQKLYDTKSKLVAKNYGLLGVIHNSKGEYDKAESFHRKALKIREEVLGENHSDTVTSYSNLANLYESKGEYDKSESFHKKALKIREELLSENPLFRAISYNNLAGLYASKGEYDKAEPLYKKALKINEEVLGENHPSTSSSYNNLGLFYQERKRCIEAKEYLEKAIASVERLEYPHISLIDLREVLKEVEGKIKKEKKANYKKRGRFCVDMKK